MSGNPQHPHPNCFFLLLLYTTLCKVANFPNPKPNNYSHHSPTLYGVPVSLTIDFFFSDFLHHRFLGATARGVVRDSLSFEGFDSPPNPNPNPSSAEFPPRSSSWVDCRSDNGILLLLLLLLLALSIRLHRSALTVLLWRRLGSFYFQSASPDLIFSSIVCFRWLWFVMILHRVAGRTESEFSEFDWMWTILWRSWRLVGNWLLTKKNSRSVLGGGSICSILTPVICKWRKKKGSIRSIVTLVICKWRKGGKEKRRRKKNRALDILLYCLILFGFFNIRGQFLSFWITQALLIYRFYFFVIIAIDLFIREKE